MFKSLFKRDKEQHSCNGSRRHNEAETLQYQVLVMTASKTERRRDILRQKAQRRNWPYYGKNLSAVSGASDCQVVRVKGGILAHRTASKQKPGSHKTGFQSLSEFSGFFVLLIEFTA
jgi:hypothetical protein